MMDISHLVFRGKRGQDVANSERVVNDLSSSWIAAINQALNSPMVQKQLEDYASPRNWENALCGVQEDIEMGGGSYVLVNDLGFTIQDGTLLNFYTGLFINIDESSDQDGEPGVPSNRKICITFREEGREPIPMLLNGWPYEVFRRLKCLYGGAEFAEHSCTPNCIIMEPPLTEEPLEDGTTKAKGGANVRRLTVRFPATVGGETRWFQFEPMCLKAQHDIPPGSKITINYGEDICVYSRIWSKEIQALFRKSPGRFSFVEEDVHTENGRYVKSLNLQGVGGNLRRYIENELQAGRPHPLRLSAAELDEKKASKGNLGITCKCKHCTTWYGHLKFIQTRLFLTDDRNIGIDHEDVARMLNILPFQHRRVPLQITLDDPEAAMQAEEDAKRKLRRKRHCEDADEGVQGEGERRKRTFAEITADNPSYAVFLRNTTSDADKVRIRQDRLRHNAAVKRNFGIRNGVLFGTGFRLDPADSGAQGPAADPHSTQSQAVQWISDTSVNPNNAGRKKARSKKGGQS